MAKSLNKTRLRDTKFLILLVLVTGIFCKTLFPDDTFQHESMDLAGYILIAICAIGRIYTTAFIGGSKNEGLVTWGPYSMTRNPLYFFSLLGAAGIGLMSTSLIAFFVIFLGFLSIYWQLILREEAFLEEKFGQAFRDYKSRVPRLWPSFRNYSCPETLSFYPKYLTYAVMDAVWWFVPLPLFEMAEILQEKGIIKPLMRVF